MSYRIGIDTGGTFTDFVLLDTTAGTTRTLKTSSTPSDFSVGVVRGLDALGVPLSAVQFIFHGATIGVNAIIEDRGEAVALLTTAGFEDILEIGWMNKPDMYNLLYTKARPLVPRRFRRGVRERIDRKGHVLTPVDPDEVRRIVDEIVGAGIRSIAVCTINAFLNRVNEDAIAAVIREEYPELHVSVSTEIINQRREFERTSTAVLNAYLVPTFSRYLTALEETLRARGFSGEFLVMKSNGGVMPLAVARRYPIHTLTSGPVGGAIGCQALGTVTGRQSLIGFDMGGTSTDVSLVYRGEPQMTDQALVHGYPVMGAAIDIGYLGAGGGSMATIEGLSSLRVGPQSAGADPGPVAYRRGGTTPCVTDANLVLGRLNPGTPLADEITLDRDAAAAAIDARIGTPLGLSTERAALGIVKIAEVKMAHAIRRVTIEQGLDPRDFALVAFGGAGPMHAAAIAAQVGIPTVIIPASPGTFSAWGMLNTDIRHDTVRTVDHAGRAVSVNDLRETLLALEREARDFLQAQDVPDDVMAFQRTVDARYRGQEHTINVAFPEGGVDESAMAQFLADFHALHQRKYAHSNPSATVEIVHVRTAGVGRLPRINGGHGTARRGSAQAARPYDRRAAVFDDWAGEVDVYRREDLSEGVHLEGPAVIEEYGCTTVLPPGFGLTVDRWLNLVIDTRGLPQ